MEKTRVKKGTHYFWIDYRNNEFHIYMDTDWREECSNKRYEDGNYFHSTDDANKVVKKLSAVIKGADVIEKFNDLNICDIERENEFESGIRVGLQKCYNWVKSKIIK